jgi:SAM-dependent methyltransferase
VSVRRAKLLDLRGQVRWPQPLPWRAAHALIEIWRDRMHGVSTRGFSRSDEFGFSPSRVLAYSPTPWTVALTVFASITIDEDDVLVDYGCGRGRMLVLALRQRFRRVVGIEIVPALAASARRNLRRYPDRWDVMEADAAAVPLPHDATVVYLFNPFGDDVLPLVLGRIRESLARDPRRLRVLTYGIAPIGCAPHLGAPAQALNAPNLYLYEMLPANERT